MKHAGDFADAALAVALAALVFWAGFARAEGVPLADPCASYDAGAPVALVATDGGFEPAPICAGQRAPLPGVFLTVAEAAALAGERAGLKQQVLDLQAAASPMPEWARNTIWVVGCLGGVAVTTYLEVHNATKH